MTAFEELMTLIPLLPPIVKADINQRVLDWFALGGDKDDPYIERQLRYAQRVLKRMEEITT